MRAGIMDQLQFRTGIYVTILGNLIYLVIIYFLWKAIFASVNTKVVNGMTFEGTMIYLVLAMALFSSLGMSVVWDMGRTRCGSEEWRDAAVR
jgi:ABC-2 type transport system permease protein